MKIKSLGPHEHVHQLTLIKWFDREYPALSGRIFAIPNGGLRNISVAVKLKLEGVRPGVPDLFLPYPSNGYHGLFIELKNEKGRPTKEQIDWVEYLSASGYKAEIVYGWIEASEFIADYLSKKD